MVSLCRTVEKLDVKDDRVRVLEEARREIQQKVDAQRQEFADRHESLRSDHEMLQKVVSHYVACFKMIAKVCQKSQKIYMP